MMSNIALTNLTLEGKTKLFNELKRLFEDFEKKLHENLSQYNDGLNFVNFDIEDNGTLNLKGEVESESKKKEIENMVQNQFIDQFSREVIFRSNQLKRPADGSKHRKRRSPKKRKASPKKKKSHKKKKSTKH